MEARALLEAATRLKQGLLAKATFLLGSNDGNVLF